jgi:quinoprotein glucose dehydrogenase
LLATSAAASGAWPEYGGDAGGTYYSDAAEIRAANVTELVPIWTFRSGDLARRPSAAVAESNFEATPILVGDRLVLCTPFNEVIALDPGTGKPVWRYDPGLALDANPGNAYTCRGVAAAEMPAVSAESPCRLRIYTGTNDGRLLALDARDGKPCEDFGTHGQLRIDPGTRLEWPGEFQITSPPVIVGGVVIVGSSITDNVRVAAPRGTVRAFDALSGAARWTWDAIPRAADDPLIAEWGSGWREAGAANVWAPMTVDRRRALVFLPTTSPSPDFYGAMRPGPNGHANSVVALNAATGTLVWAYQIVHHDLWDYDIPAQPTLATLEWHGTLRDVVVQGTKQGLLFLLDRDTGAPLSPVEERPMPGSDVAGEWVSPTQPIPARMPALVPQRLAASDAYGFTPWDRGACRDMIAHARSEGLYTPPSERGTVMFPFEGGGILWGGVAIDGSRGIAYANTTRLADLVQLVRADRYQAVKAAHPNDEFMPMRGAPYGMWRRQLLSPFGAPCNPPPWGVLAAIDLQRGTLLWQATLGTTEEIAPLHLALHTGTPTFGGPLLTAGGLVFIGSTLDRYLRAFDTNTGAELWQGRLPATAQATPMTYLWGGRQIVVIVAGGHRDAEVELGDSVVAFALPRPGEPGPTLRSRTLDRPGGRFAATVALTLAGLVIACVVLRFIRRRRATAMWSCSPSISAAADHSTK